MRPILIVVAGPNGSGKTSLTKQILEHRWIKGCHYINPDDIAQDRFGDWNDPNSVLKAAKEASRQRYQCLAERRSCAFETVFSTPEKLSFVQAAKDEGYFVRMFFVGTDGPEINGKRITRRVMEGGHSVPIGKIIDRFGKSLANLSSAIPVCDRIYVYDNSVDNQDPDLQFRTVDGAVEKTYGTTRQWADLVRQSIINPTT